ncbi:ricin-type beta-trefoil lectin domain protein [Streptomyces sp. B3I8]|uniref:ricin-type beta-trefoil lectin domain protein n=1 Tax=Streptomyces sp. B3I8 TaxID=3042303 RepID=UPI0027D91BCC|nr:ricin-type beta-trefoil lectin domain protein [Streptomyces sp. B3I8]
MAITVMAVGIVGIGALVNHQREKNKEQQVAEAKRERQLRGVATSKPTVIDVGPSAGGHGKGRSRGSGGESVVVLPGSSGKGRPSVAGKSGPVGSRTASESAAPSASRAADGSTGTGGGRSQEGTSGSGSQQRKKSSGGQTRNDDSGVPRYRIVGNPSNRCIDVTDRIYSAPDRTPLQLFDCGNNGNQQWTFYSDGTIRSLGKCMGLVGGSTANGTAVDVYTCNGSAGQRWRFEQAGDLVNVLADKCVDAKDHGTANGTRLQLYTCAGTDNQKWHVV